MVVISTLSRVIGFFREVLVTNYFGSSGETDAYFVSLALAQFFSIYLVTAINTTFIPVLAEAEADKEVSPNKIYSNILNAVLLFSIFLFLAALLFIRPLTNLIAGGFIINDPDTFELSIHLSRISILNLLIPGLLGIVTGFLQYNRAFLSSVIIGLPLNAVYIIYLVFMSGRFGIIGLTWAGVAASASQLIVLIPGLKKKNFQYVPVLRFRDPYLKKMIILSVPVIMSTVLSEASSIVDKSIATWLPTGSVTYLNYGVMVNRTFITVFIYSLAMVIFPAMSRSYAANEPAQAHRTISRSFRLTLLTAIPVSLFMIFYPVDIIRLLFERGQFIHEHTLVTANVLAMYAIGMPASAFLVILFKAYYATKDTKTPALASVLSLVFNIVLNIIMMKWIGVRGIALASSITNLIVTTFLIIHIERKQNFRLFNLNHLLYSSKIIGASLLCVVATKVFYHITSDFNFSGFSENLLFVLVAFAALSLYIALCYLFRIEEMRQLFRWLRRSAKI